MQNQLPRLHPRCHHAQNLYDHDPAQNVGRLKRAPTVHVFHLPAHGFRTSHHLPQHLGGGGKAIDLLLGWPV
ncbi:MAG: hypothetical protein HYR94_08815 [Chloroflexi bacterium]|nr:hypothetical protein [Chloroflexota bacterium]